MPVDLVHRLVLRRLKSFANPRFWASHRESLGVDFHHVAAPSAKPWALPADVWAMPPGDLRCVWRVALCGMSIVGVVHGLPEVRSAGSGPDKGALMAADLHDIPRSSAPGLAAKPIWEAPSRWDFGLQRRLRSQSRSRKLGQIQRPASDELRVEQASGRPRDRPHHRPTLEIPLSSPPAGYIQGRHQVVKMMVVRAGAGLG